MTIKSNNKIVNELIRRKKVKKFTRRKSIVTKINKQISQNVASLKARYIKTMKFKAIIFVNMEIEYLNIF